MSIARLDFPSGAALAAIAISLALALNAVSEMQKPCAGCNAKVQFVFSPEAEDEVLSLLRSAEKTIDIQVYVFTSEDVIRELGEAEKRGVRVRVIIEPRTEDKRKSTVFSLLSSIGAEVRWASMEYRLTHSKIVIVDGKKALVGSINLSESALEKNREVAVIVEGEKVAELSQMFEEDWQKASWQGG